MIYYSFDERTGEHCGQREAPIDPLETEAERRRAVAAGQSVEEALRRVVHLGPGRFETEVAPPALAAKQAAVWRGGGWQVVPDHRGETWYDPYDPIQVMALGDPMEFGLRREPIERPPTVALVKEEAAHRIERHYPVYKQLNILREGGAALAIMSAYIDAVRAASNRLEAEMPLDYRHDRHWPALDLG